jgi:hypothetical protein
MTFVRKTRAFNVDEIDGWTVVIIDSILKSSHHQIFWKVTKLQNKQFHHPSFNAIENVSILNFIHHLLVP